MRSAVPSRRLTRLGAIPLLFLTLLGLVVGGLSAPAYAAAGAITGTVTRAGALTATPLQGVTVSLLSTDGGAVAGSAPVTTGPDGTYILPTPDTGSTTSYKVKFSGTGLRDEFWNNASSAAGASSISVTNGGTVNSIDAAVASTERSEIGGLVKTSGGDAINGATVTLLKRSPADAGTGQVSYDEVVSQPTGEGDLPDGTWRLDQVFGKYVVRLSAPAFGTFYFRADNSLTTNLDDAPEIEVKEGAATPLNATLTAQTSTTISGTVTSGGTPVQGVEISVEYSSLNAQGQTTWTEVQPSKAKTAANGTYTASVPPVTDGREYVVGFKAPGFRTEFFDGATTRNGAGVITQTPTVGSPETGVSADLERATQVTGRVADQAGAALPGVTVNAVVYDTNGAQRGDWDTVIADTETLLDGTYVLDVPADTKFRLEFVSTDQRPTRYFPSASFADEATTLSVPASTALTGRNMTLPTASTIRATLAESTGARYSGSGTVSAWKEVTWTELGEQGGTSHTSWFEVPGSRATVSNGGFTVRVPQGSYRLKFVDAATTEEGFLPGLVGLDQAPDVTLGVQQTLSDQTFKLPSVQTVRGTVTDLAATPVADALVGAEYTYVQDIRDGVAQPSPLVGPNAVTGRRQSTTQVGGTYTLQLRSRTYQVFAKTDAGAAEKNYFGDLQEDGTRTPRDVEVSSVDVAGVDITLAGGVLQNTRAPWISGLNDQGSTLLANEGSWSPQSGLAFSYAWESRLAPTTAVPNPPWVALTRQATPREDGLGNPSADGRSVAIPTASFTCTVFGTGCPANAQYRVTVSASRNGGPAVAAPRTIATQLTNDTTPADELRATPRILGKAVVGEILTTDAGIWAQQTSYTYQWFRGLVAIDGATGSTYRPVPADVGSTLMVEVRPTSSPTPAPAASAPTARVGNGTLTNTRAPSISGTAMVGETLTASPGTWSPTPSSFTYSWLANGQPIAGATSASYTPVEADVAKVLTVQVTAQLAGYTPATKQSAGSQPVSLDGTDPTKIVNKTEPTVTGTAQVGRTLTAENGDWTNAPSFSYQWLADGADITGATAKTFALTAGEQGKAITVEVTARRDGFESVTLTTDPTNPVAKGVFTNEAKPSITGVVRPGSTAAALPGSWTPSSGVTYAYQWLLDNAAVSGATASTYSVTEADLDKLLSVRVTATSPGYADLSAVSDPILVTQDGDTSIDVTSPSVINGDPVVGQTLRLVVGSTSPAYQTVAIQWLRSGTPVAGRTGASYPVTNGDLGSQLAARVTYLKPGYVDEVETVTTAVVTEPTDPVKPRFDTTKKIKGNKLVLKVRVTASTQDPVQGALVLKEGSKRLAGGVLNAQGKRKLVVRGLKKGFHSVRLTFQGNDLVREGSKTFTFTIR